MSPSKKKVYNSTNGDKKRKLTLDFFVQNDYSHIQGIVSNDFATVNIGWKCQ